MAAELVELAVQTTQHLLPFLPALVGGYAAGKFADGALQKAGEDAYEFAKKLWNRLRGRRPELEMAAETAAQHLDDEDAVGAFRFQLRQLLTQEPEVADEVRALLAQQPGTSVVASGERSVAVGGNLDSSTVITGDSNRVGGDGTAH